MSTISIKEKRAERYKYRVENRLCVWCSEELDENNKGRLCPKCAEKNKNRSKELRDWYIANGICPICKKAKIYPPEKSCLNCRERANLMSKNENRVQRQREIARIRIQERKEAGLCSCGRKLDGVHKMCADCRRKQRIRRRKGEWGKLDERRWKGICKCGSDDMQEGTKLCKRCYEASCKNLEKGREVLKNKKIQDQIDRGVLLIDPPITYKKRKMKKPITYERF